MPNVTDRSQWTVKKYKLGEEPEYDPAILQMTAGQRIELVWELTKTAWQFHDPEFRESRLRRDVVRVIRRWR
jgi:dolichyl-phosphate-mannose--protein O-mannosyl transferase